MKHLIIGTFLASLILFIAPSYSQEAKSDKYEDRELFAKWQVIRPLPTEGPKGIIIGNTVWRTKIPNGWLVSNGRRDGTLFIIVDPKHEWDNLLSEKK